VKKKIAVLLIVFLFCGNALWADTLSFLGGLTCVVVGGVTAATPVAFMGGDPLSPGGLILESFGLGLIIGGVIRMVAGAGDDDASYAQARNPVLKHVSFSATTDQVYIGARFRF
jgi:predicted phage tail protein